MKLAWLCPFILLLAACTDVQVRTPNPRVETPELRGDSGQTVGFHFIGAHEYRATHDGSIRPPDLTKPHTYQSADLDGSLGYAPGGRAEIAAELHPLNLGVSGVAKLQLTGEGIHSARPGNFSSLLYVRVGEASGQQSGDQNGVFGPGGYKWRGEVQTAYLHAGVSFGYRMSENALFYLGGAYGQYWNKTEIDQDPNTSASDPGGVYKAGDSGTAQTAGAGFQFTWTGVQLSLGGEATHVKYRNTNGENDVNFTASFTFTPK